MASTSGEENVPLELAAAAANVAPGEPVSLEVVLADSTIFLDNAHWFKLLQDDGKEMTPDEICQYMEPLKGKPKKTYRTISHGGYFYQVLYSIAGSLNFITQCLK
jgi:hypothetical protein